MKRPSCHVSNPVEHRMGRIPIITRFWRRAFHGLLLLLLTAPAFGRDLAVVISEIMYNPPPEYAAGEYLELTNLGPGSVQLDGWRLAGGIDFTFPAGVRVREGSAVVVAEDAAWLSAHYGLDNVVGQYQGKLSNGGERILLYNAEGRLIDEVDYDDKPRWPTLADGKGAALELAPGESDNHFPDDWHDSLTPGGTPGRLNHVPAAAPVEWIVPVGAEWRYFKGTQEPSSPTNAWRQIAFPSESSWSLGRAGFGFGDNDDTTVLSDMQSGYWSVYLRHSFTVVSGPSPTRLALEVDYDDGFAAYLNGTEVARAHLGTAGTFVPYNQAASDHEAGVAESFDISAYIGLLQSGANVLAIQGHNTTLGSSDFSLHPRLWASRDTGVLPALSEIAAGTGGSPGFVELYNSHAVGIDLSGYRLKDRIDGAPLYIFPAGSVIPASGYLTVAEADLGAGLAQPGSCWYLLSFPGDLVDSMAAPIEAGWSRVRDPENPQREYLQKVFSPGAPNRIVPPSPQIVFNEIHYHPASATLETEWIELYNPNATAVDLEGWTLAGGVDYPFFGVPALPAGGYLVLAASPHLLPATVSVAVLGPWIGKLDNRSEELRLQDPWGNVVDEVRYSREQGFTPAPDGTGRTLERIHPALDGDSPSAWAAGPVGGTPGAVNSVYTASPPPVVSRVRHDPLFPSPQERVGVFARATSTAPLESVVVHYGRDGTAEDLTAAMHDDGVGGDLLAGDGVYWTSLPPQAANTRVRFWVVAQTLTAQTAAYPPAAPASACLYLSGGDVPTEGDPYFRVIMTAADRQALETRPVTSNVLLPCSVIADGQVRYLCGIRYRGDNARNQTDKSYRIDSTGGRPLWDLRKLNLNAYHSFRQVLGSDLFRRADVPAPLERYARMSLSGDAAKLFSQVERVDGDFLERRYPDDDGGLLYRCNDQADLGDHGNDLAYYRQYYVQRTNEDVPDHAALMALTRVFSTTDEAYFESELPQRIDVDEWLCWFAVKTVLNDDEGGLSNYSGDDYLIYQRPSDGRFILIGWDFDSVMQDPSGVIYRQTLASVRRLLRSPAFSARYLDYVVELAGRVAAPQELQSRVAKYEEGIPAGNLQALADYGLERNSILHGQLRRHLSVWTPERDQLRETAIAESEEWRFFRGTVEPSAGTTAWAQPGFDDGSWETGPSGFGYGDGDDHTLLSDMEGYYVSVYIRKRFAIQRPAELVALTLSIDYDDGFVAYLNGTEVARAHVTGSPPAYNTRASDHEAGTPETFDLSPYRNLLVDGENVLAIQGHNQSITSSDSSLIPELVAERSAPGGVALSGFAPVLSTRAVRVNGITAEYDPTEGRWEFQDPINAGHYTVEALDEAGRRVGVSSLVVPASETVNAVEADITTDTTWTAEESPYVIMTMRQVVVGATLTILPGAEVRFSPGASLWVRGRVLALGSAEAPIRFRDAGGGATWGSVMLDRTSGNNVLSHAIFSRGTSAQAGGHNFNGALGGYQCSVTVQDCTLEDNESEAIETVGCPLVVEGCFLSGNHGGIHCNNAAARLENNLIVDTLGDHDAIDFNQYPPGGFVVRGNVILNGGDDGMDSERAGGVIERNIIAGIVDSGLSLENGKPFFINNNLIYDTRNALHLKDGLWASMVYNTLVDNREAGILLEPKSTSWGAEGELVNSVVWGDAPAFVLNATSTLAVHTSLVEGGAPGAGNLDIDPRFVGPARRDYRPASDSPLLGAAGDSAVLDDLLGASRAPGAGNTLGAYQGAADAPTPTPTSTATPTPTPTATPTHTPTPTPTPTSTPTFTFTATMTPSFTSTPTPTGTATPTPTATPDLFWADLNHDGTVDDKDLLILARMVEDGEVQPQRLMDFAQYWKIQRLSP